MQQEKLTVKHRSASASSPLHQVYFYYTRFLIFLQYRQENSTKRRKTNSLSKKSFLGVRTPKIDPPPPPPPKGGGVYCEGTAYPQPAKGLRPLNLTLKTDLRVKQLSVNQTFTSGKNKHTSVPSPSVLSRVIRALWYAMPCLTIESPSPVPPTSFEWLLFTR